MATNKPKYYLLAAVILVIGALWLLWDPFKHHFVNECYERTDEPVVAVFSKSNSFTWKQVDIKHYSLVWKNTGLWTDDDQLKRALTQGDILISVETWLKAVPSGNVLSATLSGTFDANIDELGHVIADTKHRTYIRWNADMEVPTHVYPWQFQSAVLYRQAFNYVAGRLKRIAPKATVVWGPSGYPGDTEYWPGNKNVDMASITLGSASEYTVNNYPIPKTVPDMLRSKLHRMRFINKPTLIISSARMPSRDVKPVWLDQQSAYMAANADVIYSSENFVDTDKVKPIRTQVKTGVYDPDKKFINLHGITVEHIFTDIGELQKGIFKGKFNEIIDRGHDVIVTMEPWRDTSRRTDADVTKAILNGRYDVPMRQLFKLLATTDRTVYLRWMHEMEIPIHRYAWQSCDPVEYIKAFRYFMQFEGGPSQNVKKVWGPAGDRGSIDFWPGADVVDHISIAIYGLPDKNITDPKKQESFTSAFDRKFYRMRFSDKPLFITEFGVKGPVNYQEAWLKDAARTIKFNKHVFGVSYFNQPDNPAVWGKIAAPDWSISAGSMKKFLIELEKL